jgi:hypothetical protein
LDGQRARLGYISASAIGCRRLNIWLDHS